MPRYQPSCKTYGLPTSDAESEKRGGQLYENLFFRPVALREATKSQLKEAIYTGMVEFMLNDNEWGACSSNCRIELGGIHQVKIILDYRFLVFHQ